MSLFCSRVRFSVLLALFVGCTEVPECPDIAAGESPLTAPARHVLGEAAAWPAEALSAQAEADLRRSFAERRAMGWDRVSRLVENVSVDAPDGSVRSIPRFQTWYDREDLRRVARQLRRGGDGPYDAATVDAAFAWNTDAVLEQDAWPPARLAEFIENSAEGEQALGLGGIERVLYSPAAARHLIASRETLVGCVPPDAADPPPPAFVPMERDESVWLEGCGADTLGPFEVADGGSFVAEAEGEVTLRMNGEACEGPCRSAGPASVSLEVTSRQPARAQVAIRYDEPTGLWTPCLPREFPRGSAIIKTEYRRLGFGVGVGAHDTSPAGVEAVFAADETWSEGAEADPGAESIFTLELPSGARFRLVAMHVMVKELDHWVWATIWWSDTPMQDFGDDRPATLEAPWNQYKMCATTWFEEDDEAFEGASEDQRRASTMHPSETWCSNPFIESGAGAAATNCIGCHQHAGIGATSEEILAGDFAGADGRERGGRVLERTGFPTDYVFTATVIEELFREAL